VQTVLVRKLDLFCETANSKAEPLMLLCYPKELGAIACPEEIGQPNFVPLAHWISVRANSASGFGSFKRGGETCDREITGPYGANQYSQHPTRDSFEIMY
jgi:hypothetical protein